MTSVCDVLFLFCVQNLNGKALPRSTNGETLQHVQKKTIAGMQFSYGNLVWFKLKGQSMETAYKHE